MREIHYHLHQSKEKGISFELNIQYFVDGQIFGNNRNLDLSILQPFFRKEDQKLFEVLLKSKKASALSHGKKAKGFLQHFAIPLDLSEMCFALLSRLTHVFYNQKPVTFQLNSKKRVYFELQQQGKEGILLLGQIKEKEGSYFLSEIEGCFRGKHHHALIKEQRVSFFHEDTPWEWIRRAYPKPFLLQGKEWEKFKEEHLTDPSLSYASSIESFQEEMIPTPCLKLMHPRGCFANLQFLYQEEVIGANSLSCKLKNGKRNTKEERQFEQDLLEAGYQKKALDGASYYCPLDRVLETLVFLAELGWILIDASGRKGIVQSSHQLVLQEESQQFRLEGSVQFQDHTRSLEQLLQIDNGFLNIDSQHFGIIKGDLWQSIQQMKEERDGGAKGECIFPKYKMGLFASWTKNLVHCREELRAFLLDPTKGEMRLELQNFCGTLHPYQTKGVLWLANLYKFGLGGILADEMGLGKTVQILAFFSHIKTKLPILIVVPTSLLEQWKKEIEKFLPNALISVYYGVHRALPTQDTLQNHLLLTTYHTLRNDLKELQKLDFECLILDEAHIIKNPESQLFKSVITLSSRMRISITGTPVENRIEDLQSQFTFLFGSSEPHHKLPLLAKPLILRRTKEEVALDLPQKIEQIVYVELQKSQRELYERYLKNAKEEIKKNEKIHYPSVFESLLRLRQICCHPALITKETAHSEESGKCLRMLEEIEEIHMNNHKVLVFSQFTEMLGILRQYLEARQFPYLYLDGQTKNRHHLIEEFQTTSQPLIFLMSLKAGGVGVNLTAADYVFLCDPWWNEAIEAQAVARAHRIGREKPVMVRKYISLNSIEENVLKIQNKKQQLITALMDHQSSIVKDELLQLFEC